jgi:hypothetical protein
VNDQVVENNFFFQQKGLNKINNYYQVRGVLYSYSQEQLTDEQATLDIGFGNHILNRRNVRAIEPYLVVNNTSGSTSGSTYIYDLKIRPLLTPFSRCFINKGNNILMYSKNNNNTYSNTQIEDIIREKLLPYNSSILNVWL